MKKIILLTLVGVILVGTLVGCTGKDNTKIDVSITEIHEAIKEELGEDYYPNRDMEISEVLDYTGLKEDQIDEFIAQAPMISVGVDTFIAIKATEGNSDAVYQGLEKYRTYLVEDSLQYPMNLPKINAAKVLQYDDYVFFVMLGKQDESMEDAESQEAREFAEAEVTRVEKVIEEFFK